MFQKKLAAKGKKKKKATPKAGTSVLSGSGVKAGASMLSGSGVKAKKTLPGATELSRPSPPSPGSAASSTKGRRQVEVSSSGC
jgi:hypothetical protein